MLVKFYSFSTDWTIVRPGGLLNGPPTNNAILTVNLADPNLRGCLAALRLSHQTLWNLHHYHQNSAIW